MPGNDAIDRMIENAKRMRRKPFQREQIQPDRPEPAAADDTRVARKSTPPLRRGIAPYIDERLADDLKTADRNLKKYRR